MHAGEIPGASQKCRPPGPLLLGTQDQDPHFHKPPRAGVGTFKLEKHRPGAEVLKVRLLDHQRNIISWKLLEEKSRAPLPYLLNWGSQTPVRQQLLVRLVELSRWVPLPEFLIPFADLGGQKPAALEDSRVMYF